MLVDKRREVSRRRYNARADARNRHQLHHQPVNHQQAARHRCLATHAGVHHHQRRDEIANGDTLKNPGNAKLVEPETQKAVVDEAQKEEQEQPADQMHIDSRPARAGFKTPSEREGQHEADDEEKKREDQIIEVEALPRHVLELPVERVHQGMVNHFLQAVDYFLAAGNPHHVEAAKRVDRGDAAGQR